MTARTGDLVTVSGPFFGTFSHASFASLIGTETVYYGTFSRANFASMVNAGQPAFYPFSQNRQGAWSRTFSAGFLPDLETPMSIVQVLQNTATTISVFMRDGSTGLGLPGIAPAAFTIKLKKSNQVVFSTITPTVTDTGLGWYDLAITAAHTNTYGKAPMEIAATGALTRDDLVLDVIALNKFTDPVRAGLTALPNSNAGTSDGVAIFEQVANIGVTSAALNITAISRTITTGTEVGVLANSDTLDGVFHTFTDVAGVIDFYYQFDISAVPNGIGVTAQWEGYLNTAPNTMKVYAWNWISLAWDQLGTIMGSGDTDVYAGNFTLTNSNTSAGLVRIRFANTGLTTATFATDRILMGYTVLPMTTTQIAASVLDALMTSHNVGGSVGESIAIAAGLLQGNFYMDNTVNTDPNGQTSARIRIFRDGPTTNLATPGGVSEGEFATFLLTTTYTGPNKIAVHKAVKQ